MRFVWKKYLNQSQIYGLILYTTREFIKYEDLFEKNIELIMHI